MGDKILIKSNSIILRYTEAKDLDFVLESERKEENAQYVGQWSKEQHINSLSNKGYGRETLRLIKLIAFEKLSAHRLWLDVRLKNIKAQNVYKCEGFNKE